MFKFISTTMDLHTIPTTRNLLSISSHVVHGHVGNDAIQFPLNLRHWNVDCIYTTNLSNHPGFRVFSGSKTDSPLIEQLFQGLKQIQTRYDTLIVGYVPTIEGLRTIYDKILKDVPEETVVVLDPVLGDNGKFYVDERLVPIYEEILRSHLVDLVTPNQFEVQILTGTTINDNESLKVAVKRFFQLYEVPNLVITSITFPDSDEITCIAATSQGQFVQVAQKRIDAVFSGSGDLFLGILTDRFVKSGGDLASSLRDTIDVVYNVLQVTKACNVKKDNRLIDGKPYIPDLALIESIEYLRG